ncbi:MAG: flagellar biosynthesis anti-sigma factor FlgM [Polyangiaceae bacterium]
MAGSPGGVRTEKVAALKAAIADGSFQVDSSAIATRLVDEVG